MTVLMTAFDTGEMSKPKLNHQLNSTEFEVKLHSYPVIHPTHHKLNLYTQNWEELTTAQLASKDLSVQVYSHTQTSVATRGRTLIFSR